jgi:hypothetical protein
MKTATRRKVILRRSGRCAIAAVAILWGGCNNNHLLGSVDAGMPPTDDGAPGADSGPPPRIDAGPDAREIGVLGQATSWTGYIENYQFPSGSDVVKFAFASDDAGQVVGTVILGNGTPPPPATDPNVGYPPGYGSQSGGLIGGAPNYIAEGYAYPMQNGTLDGQRLRFGVSLRDLWRDWCALQTPIPGSSFCLPNWGGMYSPQTGCSQTNPATGQVVPVDCGKFSLCFSGSSVCICDPSGCRAQDDYVDDMFDVSINNDRADGSMDTHNIHFTKDP